MSAIVQFNSKASVGRRVVSCQWPLAMLIALALTLATGQSAWAQISQVPLIIQNQIAPNFTFVLDDSGSMQFAFVPSDPARDTITHYLYPPPSALYGVSNYTDYIPTFDDTNVHNLVSRSSENNAIYYDPSVEYRPWSNSDGSPMTDADAENALYNPSDSGKGTLDLTEQQTGYACWFDDGRTNDLSNRYGDPCRGNLTYWPITYYVYDGSGDRLDSNNYTKVQVQIDGSGNDVLMVNGSTTSSVPAPDSVSASTWGVAEVKQNFANWFQYYRSRILTARAGVGSAFARQGGGFRLAYGAINETANDIDGEDWDTLIRGVRDFEGSDRDAFFDFLYSHPIPKEGTPLRTALQDAGNYYERTDARNPWNTDPTSTGGEDLACRQSYSILTTDGYWNGSQPDLRENGVAKENTDGEDGPVINNPNGADYQYIAKDPYEDSYKDTLADTAMHFWRRDLQSNLDNIVPVVPEDPAFWQHMVTFGVSFGLTGTLNPETDLSSLSDGSLEWPDPTDTEDAERIDDLWHAGVNSRGGFLSAKDPQGFAEQFTELLEGALARTEGSAAAIATNSGQIDTDTRLYQARFESTRWSGDLMTFGLTTDGSIDADNDGDIDDDVIWRASDHVPSASNRSIYTYDPGNTQGIPLEWTSLTSSQQTALDTDRSGTNDGEGQERLAYLRGDTTKELQEGGPYRNRFVKSDGSINVLGDIVNSSPFLASKRDFGYQVLPGTEGADYVDYRFSDLYTDRPDMIYVGANDGMFHAFNAGDPNTAGSDPGEGTEEFAFVPSSVFDHLSDLTSPKYTHRYYVDESPRKIDAYFDHDGDGAEEWRSVVISSTGAGGKSVFALDVTDPENFSEGDVLWEYTHSDLGFTMNRPTIARLPDGDFYALFGDGYDNTTIDGSGNTVVDGDGSATAKLFIVNLSDGTTKKIIDTQAGSSSDPNGLSTVVPIDYDDDRIVDIIYAGDLEGNLWKFDVSSSNTNNWDVANSSGGSPAPLFQAEGPNGETQPIVVRPEVVEDPEDGVRTILFGTGKAYEVGDLNVGSDPDVYTSYAIRDTGSIVTRSDLLEQTIESETTQSGETYRFVSNNSVSSSAREDGWYIDLKLSGGSAEGERVVTQTVVRGNRAIFVSQVPPANDCEFAGTSWLYEVNAFSGARLQEPVFPDGNPVNGDYPSAIRKDDVITRPTVLEAGGDTELKFMSRSSGGIEIQEETDSIDADYGRSSWRQLQ